MLLYLPRRALARAILSMSRPGQKSTITSRRVRGFLLAASWALCCSLPLSSWAGRPVRVYEVDVDGKSAAALQEAMRQVLVRATGRRDAAEDPALSALVNDAPKYVQSYTTGPRGESQVVFDAAAVEQAIGAAGRSTWDRVRPFTLVALAPPRNRAAGDAARAELERVAAERGLPVSLIPLQLSDAAGAPLSTAALLQAAQRFGGDEILVGRGAAAAADSPLQWTLYRGASSDTWSGPLAAGIDHTVDLLVPQPGGALALAESDARVEIVGVNSLDDYANVTRLLQSVPGVRRASIVGADGASLIFEVTVRGGAAGLEQALAGQARLGRASAPGGPSVYRYQPQG
jgi:uncharacterized protein